MLKPSLVTRDHFLQTALVLSLALAGTLVAKAVHAAFVYKRNMAQLSEMSAQLLRSTELAIDYAIITLSDTDSGELMDCTPASVRAVRQRIIQRGSLKEIEVRGRKGELVCAGLGVHDELVARDRTGIKTYTATNENMTLSAQGSEGDGLLRVSWQQTEAFSIDAIINLDTAMFDVFPAALREDAEATVWLAGGEVIAQYSPNNPMASSDGTERFEVRSSRYPVTTQLTVPSRAIANWNAGSSLMALGIGALLGGVIGAFLARLVFRAADPVTILRKAVQKHEIQPYFQPIFSLADTNLVGCEVLMRWISPNGSIITPDRFIPLAESSGLIDTMTVAVARNALRQLTPLLLARPDFKVAFNVTPRHFMADTFVPTFCNLVTESGIAPRQIVIELTERQSFEHAEQAAMIAAEIRNLGFRLALDDMGSGHNGLSQVQGLPIDIIKIDKNFVDLIVVDQAATSIVQMIARLARDLGKSTVAEGIETEAQRLKLLQCGIDEGQGYLVSPPLSFLDFLAHVERSSQGDAAAALKQIALTAAA